MQLALRTEHIPFSSLCAFFDAAEARQRAGQDIINMVMGRPDFLPRRTSTKPSRRPSTTGRFTTPPITASLNCGRKWPAS